MHPKLLGPSNDIHKGTGVCLYRYRCRIGAWLGIYYEPLSFDYSNFMMEILVLIISLKKPLTYVLDYPLTKVMAGAIKHIEKVIVLTLIFTYLFYYNILWFSRTLQQTKMILHCYEQCLWYYFYKEARVLYDTYICDIVVLCTVAFLNTRVFCFVYNQAKYILTDRIVGISVFMFPVNQGSLYGRQKRCFSI